MPCSGTPPTCSRRSGCRTGSNCSRAATCRSPRAKCYDIETYAPGVGTWLEVSSCSDCRDFQSRQGGIRFRREPGARPEFPHLLNGSGLALPRIVATLLETYQRSDGSVEVPTALQPYMDGRAFLMKG